MNMRELMPWSRNQQAPSEYRDDAGSFMTLHREMNRLFDDVFRTLAPPMSGFGRLSGWPNIEVAETDRDVRISAELPGMEEKDVEVFMSDDVLTIRGEKTSEASDKDRRFSERSYGRFERRIPLGWEVDESKVEAAFKNGVLTVVVPKSEAASSRVRRIAIKGQKADTKH
jgi:HSP20 family protein